MNYNSFLNQITKDKISSAYLFMGKEEYLMKSAIEILKKKYIGEGFETLNYIDLEGKNIFIEDLINACETLPFMNDKKIVVLKDVKYFIENIDHREKELYDYLDRLGDHLILIFLDGENLLKKNRKIYKYFKKRDTYVEFSKLKGRDLNNWIDSILKKHDKKISSRDAAYFIQESSYNSRNIEINLYDLENQLLQIIDYKKEKTIDRESIDKVLIKSIDTNIFQLLDALSNFDSDKSLYIFNEMYRGNEPILKILFMITRQIRLILGYKLYREKGYRDKNIQNKLGIKPFEFRKISGIANRFSRDYLTNVMEELLEVDRKIKSTSIDDKLIMEMLIVKLSLKDKKQNFG